MKNKKLLAAIVAVTMSATTVAVAFSGCNKHTHEYTDWTVTTPATCTTEGVETGTCKADGKTGTRVIPALGHKYGTWQTVEPTADKEGSASNVCATDPSHTVKVALPKLGDSKYTVKKLEDKPTYAINQYTYAHADGDIVFAAKQFKKDVSFTVEDAVETATDTLYSSLVGKGVGTSSTKLAGSDKERVSDLLYEYGKNYTHVKGDSEYWLEKDAEDKISGIVFEGGAYREAGEQDADMFAGYNFINPANYDSCYGAEELLGSLYEAATEPNEAYNTQFTESVNGDVYSFSWTVVNLSSNSKQNTDFIYHFTVDFTLGHNYMLKTFTCTTETFAYSYDLGATKPYDFDEATYTYSPKQGEAPGSTKVVTLTQTAFADLEEIPENPWNFDEIAVDSFDLFSGRQVSKYEFDNTPDNNPDILKQILGVYEEIYMIKTRLKSGEADITTAGNLQLYLDDFTPGTAGEYISLNPVKVYIVEDGKETLVLSSEEFVHSDTGISGYYDNANKSILLTCRQATGDFSIKICVGDAVKTFKLHVSESAPEKLVTMVNLYNDAKDSYDTKKTDSVTVYKGQTLTFTTDAGDFYDPYDPYIYDASADVTLAAGTQNATLTATDKGHSFVATAAGTYNINVVSKLDQSVSCVLTVVVEEAPDVEAMLNGNYTAGDFEITFNTEGGTVNVVKGTDVNETFSYTYLDGVLTATSADNKYSVQLTENYKLVLVYSDDFEESHREILKVPSGINMDDVKAALAELVGKWTFSIDGFKVTIVLNSDGTATFSDGMAPGTVALTYELVDNGGGVVGINFSNGKFNGWFGVMQEGSTLTFDGTQITNVKFDVFDVYNYGTSIGVYTATFVKPEEKPNPNPNPNPEENPEANQQV